MFKYIGIRGHRGAGKNTISYLLGIAIDFYLRNDSWDGFDEVYKKAVERVLEDENFLDESDFKSVFFESFADTAKVMLSQLVGIPTEYMYNDWCKDSVIVDMKDFSFVQAKDKLELEAMTRNKKLYDANELKKCMNEKDITLEEEHVFIKLRELISYFSKYVMQSFFGKNVWIKSLEVNRWESERFYTGSGKTIYKIFIDCKFPSEISYIYMHSGKIIKINRDNNVKENTNISEELEKDNRFDYEINLDGNLLKPETLETIKSITLKIISE